jgi:integrase
MAGIRPKRLKDGSSSYEVRILRAGYPKVSRSFRSKREALAWARKVEAGIDQGKSVRIAPAKFALALVIAEFREHYADTIVPSESQRLDTLERDLGEFSVAAFTPEIVEKYIKALLAKKIPPPDNKKKTHYLYNGDRERCYSDGTVRKFYYQLKKVMQWHARHRAYALDPYLFDQQPVPPAWSGERSRRLEADEESRLYLAADAGYSHQQALKNVVRFAIETAMRAQEVLKSRWQDLNMAGRTLNIPAEHVKTKTFRQVPLSSRAIDVIKSQLSLAKTGDERIFWQWKDSIVLGRAFKRLCYRAKIADLRFHDLRHEATSRFFERGRLSDMEIMKITGHTQYSTLQRYVKLRPSVLAEKMD